MNSRLLFQAGLNIIECNIIKKKWLLLVVALFMVAANIAAVFVFRGDGDGKSDESSSQKQDHKLRNPRQRVRLEMWLTAQLTTPLIAIPKLSASERIPIVAKRIQVYRQHRSNMLSSTHSWTKIATFS